MMNPRLFIPAILACLLHALPAFTQDQECLNGDCPKYIIIQALPGVLSKLTLEETPEPEEMPDIGRIFSDIKKAIQEDLKNTLVFSRQDLVDRSIDIQSEMIEEREAYIKKHNGNLEEALEDWRKNGKTTRDDYNLDFQGTSKQVSVEIFIKLYYAGSSGFAFTMKVLKSSHSTEIAFLKKEAPTIESVSESGAIRAMAKEAAQKIKRHFLCTSLVPPFAKINFDKKEDRVKKFNFHAEDLAGNPVSDRDVTVKHDFHSRTNADDRGGSLRPEGGNIEIEYTRTRRGGTSYDDVTGYVATYIATDSGSTVKNRSNIVHTGRWALSFKGTMDYRTEIPLEGGMMVVSGKQTNWTTVDVILEIDPETGFIEGKGKWSGVLMDSRFTGHEVLRTNDRECRFKGTGSGSARTKSDTDFTVAGVYDYETGKFSLTVFGMCESDNVDSSLNANMTWTCPENGAFSGNVPVALAVGFKIEMDMSGSTDKEQEAVDRSQKGGYSYTVRLRRLPDGR